MGLLNIREKRQENLIDLDIGELKGVRKVLFSWID